MTVRIRAIQFRIEPTLVAVDSETLDVSPIQVEPIVISGNALDSFAEYFAAQVAEQEALMNQENQR